MRRLSLVATRAVIVPRPRAAFADIHRVPPGSTDAPERPFKGAAGRTDVYSSGFEFEYADTGDKRPQRGGEEGRAAVADLHGKREWCRHRFTIAGMQFYAKGRRPACTGSIEEHLRDALRHQRRRRCEDESGGACRLRWTTGCSPLKGSPAHGRQQRFYAGLNLKFKGDVLKGQSRFGRPALSQSGCPLWFALPLVRYLPDRGQAQYAGSRPRTIAAKRFTSPRFPARGAPPASSFWSIANRCIQRWEPWASTVMTKARCRRTAPRLCTS